MRVSIWSLAMAISLNPAINFTSNRTNRNYEYLSNPTVQDVPQEYTAPKQQPARTAFSDIAKFFVSTSEMTKATIKAVVYGFLTGTAIAGYKWATKAIPNAFKEGGSLVETMKHPAKSIGWKGNLFAGVAALGVASFQIVKGKLKTNQRTANVDHQLYTGHRDI